MLLYRLALRRSVADYLRSAPSKATWRSGYAEDCKSFYPGSIPGVASTPAFAATQLRLGKPFMTKAAAP